MAAATIVNTSYGFQAKTGTDATAVTTTLTNLQGIEIMGSAGAETVTVTDTAGNGLLLGTITTANQSQVYDMKDIKVDGIKVTLSAASVRANFFVR